MKKSAPNSTRPSTVKRTTESSVVTRFSIVRKTKKQVSKPAVNRPAERVLRSIDMGKLEAEIHESPTINASKIVDIHRRIIAGEYKIDTKRLAEKVIELESILDSY